LITENDLRQAIAECQGERNPNANTCLKLASYLTIQDHLFGAPDSSASFSAASESLPREGITYQSNTDFSRAVYGKNADDVLAIVDDLMDALHALCPRLYRNAMRHFEEA
jgi:hypothetical protein